MSFKFFLILLPIFILPLIVRCQNTICNATKIPRDNVTSIDCYIASGVDERSLDDVLLQTRYKIDTSEYTFDQMASTTNQVKITTAKDLILNTNTGALARLTQLMNLEVIKSLDNNNRIRLTVPRQGFEKMPKLQSLELKWLTLAESTVQALEDLKDQVSSLWVEKCAPGKQILKEVAKFTNLTRLTLERLCEDEAFPETTFENSASKLNRIVVWYCSTKNNVLTKKMFKGMSNLQTLIWRSSNITTIEPGAFDNLTNLSILTLINNRIKSLPSGLFDNNKKLVYVNIAENGVENLSHQNFTHYMYFSSLIL